MEAGGNAAPFKPHADRAGRGALAYHQDAGRGQAAPR